MSNTPMRKNEVSPATRSRWPKLLLEFIEVLSSNFVRRGYDKAKADDEAKAATLALASYLGGQAIYLPFGQRLKTALQHDEIFRRANGRNTLELANEYGLTSRRIMKIVQEQAAQRRAARELADAERGE